MLDSKTLLSTSFHNPNMQLHISPILRNSLLNFQVEVTNRLKLFHDFVAMSLAEFCAHYQVRGVVHLVID